MGPIPGAETHPTGSFVLTQVNGVRDAARERLEFRGYHNLETLMSDPTRGGGQGSHHRAEGGGGNLPPRGGGAQGKKRNEVCTYAKTSAGLFGEHHNLEIVVLLSRPSCFMYVR